MRRKKFPGKGTTTMITKTQQDLLSPGPRLLPIIVNRQVLIFVIFLLVTTTTIVQAVPARMLGSSGSNKIVSTSSSALNNNGNNANRNSNSALVSGIPEEELELESLKGSAGDGTDSSPSKSAASTPAVTISSTSRPVAYVKKPENEETPALSDNANSLKYGGANADLEEALANMAHIPANKLPSLSVKTNSVGGFPMGDSILQQQKRTRSPNFGDAAGGMGLLTKARQAAGVNLEVDYTPQDIAEYIFWMGDERSVELALTDFVQDGLITAQDAVRFLEDVKGELNSLRNRYASTVALGRIGSSSTGMDNTSPHQDERGFWDAPARSVSKRQSYLGSGNPSSSKSYFSGGGVGDGGYYSPSSQASALDLINSPYYSSGSESPSSFRSFGKMYKDVVGGNGGGMPPPATSTNSLEDMLDYEEIVDKLKQADTKMREIALESIIYQLARDLFSMGLQQSSGTSVPTFTKFIENLSVNGSISKDLERSVLETLVQALVDAANERGLLNAKSSSSSSQFTSLEGQLSSLAEKSGFGSGPTKPPIFLKKKNV